MLSSILFEYTLGPAWGKRLMQVKIYDREYENVVVDCSHEVLEPDIRKHTMPAAYLDRIREIVSDDRIYAIGDITFPPILQGTVHRAAMSDGTRRKSLTCFNLWYFKENENDPSAIRPNADTMMLIDKIEQISDILKHTAGTDLLRGRLC